MKHILFLLSILPLLANAQMESNDNNLAQHDGGIRWLKHMNWQEIKALAKVQNKFIFVDCNATWCQPCKIMERNIFTNDTIINLVNEKFIAVKVQVDTSKSDDASTRNLYEAAREFESKYQITGVPAFLFFSPNGEILHKETGGRDVSEFIKVVGDALDPSSQMYTLIKNCRLGKLDYNIVPSFIKRLNYAGDKEIALELARLYMKNYLEKLPDALFSSRINLDFIVENETMLISTDKIYKLCYENPSKVDSSYGFAGLGDILVTNILVYEYVMPSINKARKESKMPDWNAMRQDIYKKASTNKADKIILDTKIYWYAINKDWLHYAQYYFYRASQQDLSKFPSKDQLIAHLNMVAWDLFRYSFNKEHLERALMWINKAIALQEETATASSALLDTQANLLYKLGKKKEAIIIEEKAVSSMKIKNASILAALEKMKRGEPTWEQY